MKKRIIKKWILQKRIDHACKKYFITYKTGDRDKIAKASTRLTVLLYKQQEFLKTI